MDMDGRTDGWMYFCMDIVQFPHYHGTKPIPEGQSSPLMRRKILIESFVLFNLCA